MKVIARCTIAPGGSWKFPLASNNIDQFTAVARKKAKARARRELAATHPTKNDAFPRAHEADIEMLVAGLPGAAPADHCHLF